MHPDLATESLDAATTSSLLASNDDLSSSDLESLAAAFEASARARSVTPVLDKDAKSASSSFVLPAMVSREALTRQIHLLELSNKEITSIADAKAKSYELKIASLEGEIVELQKKNLTIAKLRAETTDKSAADQITHDDFQGLAKLNSDILQQNSDLRIECARLRSKLEFFAGSAETDDSETGASFVKGVPTAVAEEVGRILNPKSNMVPLVLGTHPAR
ncbi:hypothetical protein HDU91_003374 [Kappamyces sp. JEL0680]|nr:hypothetical protein HDU91_003374 [Kappamyces sp. JEL0680]